MIGPPDPREVLDNIASATMGHLWELVGAIPGGTDEDRCSLATTVIGEILARTLASIAAPAVAGMTNVILVQHSLAWRLVQVS